MNPGYFLDTEYIDYFYDGMSPWYLNYLAVLAGLPRPDPAAGFDYCELGCGSGLSLVIHAAANPGGRFLGVDLNREHIARATRTAQAGQVANVTFLEEDIAQLLERDLPRFDVIALHGVYSWVGPAARREILAFIGHRLRPGGLVYVSYNALPGWGQQEVVREILLAAGGDGPGATLDRVALGLAHLRRLRDAHAPSVADSPQVRALVDHLLAADPRYVAHEFFTPHWEAFPFRKVAGDFARAGLTYLGSLPLLLNYGFCLPDALRSFFQGLPAREDFETHKDLVLNTVFRRDVFGLGRPGPRPERLDGVVLGSFLAREDFRFQFQAKANQVHLEGPVFPPLADLLAGARMPAADLFRHPALARFAPGEIREGLELLLASGQVLPMAPDPGPAPAGLSPLNRHLIERDTAADENLALACPAAGTGLRLARTDALILLGIAEAGPEGAAAWAQAWADRHGLQLAGGEAGKPLPDLVRERIQRLPCAWLGLPTFP